ncbi:hypothetical protein OUZ56_032286 [Daphnia magna]|uniref:Uncharacterized protein n=1 Tax=Daphnia magna TaxID=35525 RepID=A0ABQ9ZWR1_9CRUS|nr:hypothetical protein OUZ56_032286 [Daphnia magna]
MAAEIFQPVDAIIGFKQVNGEHSGTNLGEQFYDIVSSFQLNEQMLALTTDNASSNGTFIDHIIYLSRNTYRPFKKEYWIRCFAHLRDLVVGIKSSPQWIEKIQRIAKYYEVEDEELDYEEDEKFFLDGGLIPTDLLPILDCPTKDFAVLTTYVEVSQYPTLSLVVPMYNRLLDQLEEASRDHSKHPLLVQGAAAGFAKLSSYYNKAFPLVMAATFVDPRCKMKYFIDNGWSTGGGTYDAYIGTDENLIISRVKPA